MNNLSDLHAHQCTKPWPFLETELFLETISNKTTKYLVATFGEEEGVVGDTI